MRRRDLKLCLQVIGIACAHPSCPSKKGGAHRWKEAGINWPNSLPNQSLCFSDSLIEGADGSGGWTPLIGSTKMDRAGGWVVMAVVAVTSPYTWCSHFTSVNTDTFILITSSLELCADFSSAASRQKCPLLHLCLYYLSCCLLPSPKTQLLHYLIILCLSAYLVRQ